MAELKSNPATATTVEQTSKSLKLQKVLAALAFIVGTVWLFSAVSGDNAETPTGAALLTLGGLVWYVVTRVRAWWHHG